MIFIVSFTATGKKKKKKKLPLKLESFTLEFSKLSITSSSTIHYSISLATSMAGREFKIIYGEMPLEKFPIEIESLKLNFHFNGYLVNKTTTKSSL